MTTTKPESPRESPQRPALLPIQPSNNLEDGSFGVSEISAATLHVPPVLPLATEPIPPSNSDLSVIAEDEEPSERNGHSTSKRQDGLPQSPLVMPQAITFDSIPLDSSAERIQQQETFPQTTETFPIEDVLPKAQASQSLNDKDHVMTDVQAEISQKLTDKPNAAPFPPLSEPMPLRKSMKAPRDPSMNAVLLGAATPGAPVGGKRTSWLMRAREAKALEGLGKKSHPPGMSGGVSSSSSLALQGTKRKSDPFSLPQVGIRDDERPPKVAKTSEGDTVSNDSKDLSSMRTPGSTNIVMASNTESRSRPPEVVGSAQEGVLDRLKKTVEGLGVRVGKSVGKSMGSDTATVLAEARAAAKAKVAERDRKEEKLTMALPVPETVERKTVAEQENEKRLSVSDLFPAEGRVKEKHKVAEKPFQFMLNMGSVAVHATTRESTSTTPPHSPSPQSQIFTMPSGPVFNKPPVFVPPIWQVATKPIASPRIVTDVVSKSNGQSTTASSFSPRLPSPLPKATNIVPLTAHSTLESMASDAVFDDDVPAWMPSTQDTEYTMYGSQSQPQDNQLLDEDDSCCMDEKLADGVQWAFGVSKEDSTWSTQPSQSQRADTGPITRTLPITEEVRMREEVAMKEPPQRPEQIPRTFNVDMEEDRELHGDLEIQDAELEELVLSAPKVAGPAEVR